ncbi:hypothetical protein [Naasia lichenicola]|uniref:Uncharacterized protein n=1 Tax=Naasia lichenicola TaxID=2565933 RepID=A0A4S4FNF0_9MICO|nr:hypothetical protein [Naasia lichenicola]THG30786.1 hypothetical protein E6C64_09105 [Naasia lichenicola]THG32023.1 hypothetical protein E6C64_08250 [Naasia lichenicola]
MTRRRIARVTAGIAVLATVLSVIGCAPSSSAGPSALRATANSLTQPTIAAPEVSEQAIEELKILADTDSLVGTPVEITYPDAIPSDGLRLTRSYAEALPDEVAASFMYFDENTESWTAVPSALSADRRMLTATVHHLSLWDDIVSGTKAGVGSVADAATRAGQSVVAAGTALAGAASSVVPIFQSEFEKGATTLHYGVGSLLTARVDAPSCAGLEPDWVDNIAVPGQGSDDSVLFCAGADPSDDDQLLVKARVNRGFGFTAKSYLDTVAADNDTYDDLIGQALTAIGATDSSIGQSIADLTADGDLVGPGAEVDYTFERAAFGSGYEGYVVELTPPTVLQFVASTLASTATRYGVSQAEGTLGAVLAVASCASSIYDMDDAGDIARAVLECISANDEAFAKQLAVGLLELGKTPKEAGALAGKILGRISIVLAILPAVINEYDFAFEQSAADDTRRVTIEVGTPPVVKGVGSTKVVDLMPWSDESIIEGAISMSGNFSCDTSAISGRADAYRCFGEDAVLDPCFIDPDSPNSPNEALCGDGTTDWERVSGDFVAHDGVDVSDADPLGVELEDGRVCSRSTGAGPTPPTGYSSWLGGCAEPGGEYTDVLWGSPDSESEDVAWPFMFIALGSGGLLQVAVGPEGRNPELVGVTVVYR